MYQSTDINLLSFQEIWEQEYGSYKIHRGTTEKWFHLERLHIISQIQIQKHYSVHFLMMYESMRDKNLGEFVGQIIRILLVLPGHVLQKLPKGNIGTTRVGVLKSMDIPSEFQHLFL